MDEISRRWWIGYVCAFVLVFSSIVLAKWLLPGSAHSVPPQLTAAELPEMTVGDLLARLRRSREAIHSYRMLVAWEIRSSKKRPLLEQSEPDGEVVSAGKGVWMEKGACYRVEKHCDVSQVWGPKSAIGELVRNSPPGGSAKLGAANLRQARKIAGKDDLQHETGYVSEDQWYVFNGMQQSSWSSMDNGIHLNPVEHVPNAATVRQSHLAPSPLRWGFDLLEHSIDETIGTESGYTWTIHAADAEDGPRYVLSGEAGADGPNTNMRREIELDPLRDYLIRRDRTWKKGKLIQETVVTLQQATGGTWYTETGIRMRGHDTQTVHLSEAEFNLPLDDALFHWENMPFDAATVKVHKRTGEKTSTTLRFKGGYWAGSL